MDALLLLGIWGGGSPNGPIFNLFIEDNFVAKDNNIKLAVGYEAIENISARLASSLDVQGANTNDTPGSWFCYGWSKSVSTGKKKAAAAHGRDMTYPPPFLGDAGRAHCWDCGC